MICTTNGSAGTSPVALRSTRPRSRAARTSFALWAQVLRDGRCGPHFYSANVVGCMRRNRRSVPPYLRQMATRHGSAVASRLLAAAEIYESVLAKLGTADTSKEAFANAAGREALAHLVDEVAIMEGQAVGELNDACQQMRSTASASNRGRN